MFSVVECGECQFLRLFPRIPPGELKNYYPPDYYFAPDDGVSQAAEIYRRFVLGDHVRFVKRAARQVGVAGPLLDVGCSGGLLARLLRDDGLPVMGFDNSNDAAVRAWKVNGVPVVCGDFLRAPLADHSCSVVTMFHVLEHVPAPKEFLEAAHRLLKPEGRLIVQVPNAASWQFLMFGERWNGVDVPRHLWNFRAAELETLLKGGGFEIVRRKFFSLRDNPAGMATSLAPSLDPMSRRVLHRESATKAMLKNLAYLGLTAACLPFAMLEAACGAGSTVMIEAKPAL